MEYLVTGRQAKAIDTYTIEQTGIPSLVLMERASLCVAEEVQKTADQMHLPVVRIAVVCGSGNNGGDGIAAARILHERGLDVCIFLAGKREKMSADCQKQLAIAEKLSVPIGNGTDLSAYNIIIDAIFGIGLDRPVEGNYRDWITAINHAASCGSCIIAIDIPSGIHTDSGHVMGLAVRARKTVTFGYIKTGLVFYPGADYAGQVICRDIGFDPAARKAVGLQYITYTKDDCQRLPKRCADSNKGTYGHVLIIAGSKNMAGAAYFSSLAAYRMGVGLVTVYTPESNRCILQQLLPEAVLKTYPDTQEDFSALPDLLKNYQAIVLGPGLGQGPAAENIVRTVTASDCQVPLIIDADALNILSKNRNWLSESMIPTVITPHMKELSRLTGHNIQYLKENLVQVCEAFTREYGVICIAEDTRTMIIDNFETIYINLSGNNGMSTGGSGDILTGMIAGLCGQHMPLNQAARLGVYLHGHAGDIAASSKGFHSMTASDVLNAIPELLKKITMN